MTSDTFPHVRYTRRTLARSALLWVALTLHAEAAALLWDANASTAGITDGAGTWTTANTWWNPTSNANATWAGGDNATIGMFGAGGTINSGGNITVGSLRFRGTSAYTIAHTAAATLTLSGGLTVDGTPYLGAWTPANAVTVGSANLNLVLGGNQIWKNNNNDLLTIGGAVTGTVGQDYTLTIGGVGDISIGTVITDATLNVDKTSLVKSTIGRLTLSGANNFTGGLTLSEGILILGNDAALGNAANSVFTWSGGELQAVTAARSLANAITVGGDVLASGSLALTFSGAMDLDGSTRVFNLLNSATTTFSGVISNGGLTKAGSLHTNTGAVTLTQLTLANANSFAGGARVNWGTLQLDFANAVAPVSDIINAANALTLYGGVLEARGKGAANNSQAFNGVSLIGAGTITGTQNGAASLNIALGAITRSAPGTVTFNKPTTGNITTTTTNDGTGILGPWASYAGTDYATVNAGNLAALNTSATAETAWTSATGNYTMGAGQTLTASRSVNTLRSTGAYTLGLGNLGFTFAANAILSGGGGTVISRTGTTESLVIGTSGELVLFGSNNFTLQVPITGTGNLVKAGAGTLTLNTNASSFNGTTYVTGGTMSLGIASALGTSNPTVMSGGILTGSVANILNGRTVTVNEGGTVYVPGVANLLNGATINVNNRGFLTTQRAGTTANCLAEATINLNSGATANLDWGGGNGTWGGDFHVYGNSILIMGGNNATTSRINSLELAAGRLTIVDNDQGLDVNGTLLVYGAASLAVTPGSYQVDMRAKNLSGSGTFTKTGPLSLNLYGPASGFTGAIVVDDGALIVSSANAVSGATAITLNSGGWLYANAVNCLAGINPAANITINTGGVLVTSLTGTTDVLAGTGATNPIRMNGGTAFLYEANVTGSTSLGGYFRIESGADGFFTYGAGNAHRISVGTVEFQNNSRLIANDFGNGAHFSARNVVLPAGGSATVQNLNPGNTVALGGDPAATGTITYTGNTQLTVNGSASVSTAVRGILAGGTNIMTVRPVNTATQLGDATYALVGTGGIQPYDGLTLKSGAANTINGVLSFNNIASTVYELNNNHLVIGTLTGGGATGGNVNNNGAAIKTLATGLDNATGTYNGTLTANTAANMVLAKIGSGTQGLGKASTYTGQTWLLGGTLNLDFSQSTAPAANIISASSALNLMGGTLTLTANGASDNDQTFNGTTVQPGYATVNASSLNNAGATVTLAALANVAGNIGGAVTFTLPGSGQITTTQAETQNILGPAAFVGGNDYADKSGSNIVALNNAVSSDETSWAANGNLSFSEAAVTTLTTARQPNTLRYIGAGAKAIDLGGATSYNLTPLGMLNAGTGLLTIQRTGPGTQGSVVLTNSRDLVLHTGANGMAISAPITGGNSSSKILKVGTGDLTLSGANSPAAGATLVVGAGKVVLGNAAALNTATAGSYMGATLAAGGGQTATLDLAGSSFSVGALNTASASINGTTTYADGDQVIDNSVNTPVTLTATASGTFVGRFAKSGGASAGITLVNNTAGATLNLANFSGTASQLAGIQVGNGGVIALSNVGRAGVGATMSAAQMQDTLGGAPVTVNAGGQFTINAPSAAWGAFVPSNAITVKAGGKFYFVSGVPVVYTGPLTVEPGGIVQVSANVTLPNTLTFPTEGFLQVDSTVPVAGAYPALTGTLAIGGAGNLTTSSAGNISSDGGARTLALNTTSATVTSFAGVTLNGDLTVAGSGNSGLAGMTPSGGSNLGTISEDGSRSLTVDLAPAGLVQVGFGAAHTGGTTVNSGTLAVSSGLGGKAIGGGTTAITLNGGTLRFQGDQSVSWSDPIVVDSASTLEFVLTGDQDRQLKATGAISGSGPLTVRSRGTNNQMLGTIAGSHPGYTGGFRLEWVSGTSAIRFDSANSLGGGGAGSIVVPPGVMFGLNFVPNATDAAKFALDAGGESLLEVDTFATGLDLNALGWDLRLSGLNTVTFPGTWTPYASTYKLAPLTRNETFTINAAKFTDGGGARNLDIRAGAVAPGATTVVSAGPILITAAQNYSGTTYLGGVVRNALMGGGVIGPTVTTSASLGSTSGITLDNGAIFTLTGGTTGAASLPVVVRGGSTININWPSALYNTSPNFPVLTLGGDTGGGTYASAANGAQTLLSLTVRAGASTVNPNATGVLTLGGTYTRNAGGFVSFRNTNATFSGVPSGSTSGSGTDTILVGALLNKNGWVKADSSGVLAPATLDTANAFNTGKNATITANSIVSSTVTINSMRASVAQPRTVTVNSSVNLNVASGGIVSYLALSQNGQLNLDGATGTLSTGGSELFLVVSDGGFDATMANSVAPQITGTPVLNVVFENSTATARAHAETLSNPANAIGDIYVSQATAGTACYLDSSAAGAIGPVGSTDTIYLFGSGIRFANSVTQNYSGRKLVVGPQGGTYSDSGTAAISSIGGNVTLNGLLTVSGTGQQTLGNGTGSVISGAGVLKVSTASLFTISGPNAGSNIYTGGIILAGTGTKVRLDNPTALGDSSGPVVANAGVGGLTFTDNVAGLTAGTTFANSIVATVPFYLQNWEMTGPVILSGRIVGTTGLLFQGYDSGSSVSEIVLSGTVSMSGVPSYFSYGTSTVAQNFVNGQAGMTLGGTGYRTTTTIGTTTEGYLYQKDSTSAQYVDGAEGYVRFNGANSFIPGAVGPGYLAAVRKGGTTQREFGYLLTATASPATYSLPQGKSFCIGSLGSGTQPYGTLGAAGSGTAILAGAPALTGMGPGSVHVHANAASDNQSLNLFARASDTVLQLGVAGPDPVVFTPSYGDSASATTITVMKKRTGTTTLNKIGDGSVVIKNVDCKNTDGTDARTGFTWNVSAGVVQYDQTDSSSEYAAFNVNNGGTLSGTGTLKATAMALADNAALASAGTLTLVPGTSGLALASGTATITLGTVLLSGVATIGGALNASGSGALTVGATGTLGGTGTVGAPVTLASGATLTSPGTLTLDGTVGLANGNTASIAAGTVSVGNVATINGTLNGSSQTLNVGATGTLVGTGTVNPDVTVAAGGALRPAGTGAVGELTMNGAVTLGGGAYFEITGNADDNTYDKVNAAGGSVAYGGTLTVACLTTDPTAAGTYTLFSAGSHSGTFSTINLPDAPAGFKWHDYGSGVLFDYANGQIQLEPLSGAVIKWSGAMSGSWETGGNWVGGNMPGSGDIAQFYDTGAGYLNSVSLASAEAVSGLKYVDATSSVTIGGSALTVGADGITVATSSTAAHTINANIVIGAGQTWNNLSADALTLGGDVSGSGQVVKLGAGDLVLNGNNSFSGAFLINGACTVTLGHNSALGNTADGTTVASGATLDLNGRAIATEALTVSGMGIGNSGALINTAGGSASWSGTVTLGANSLVNSGTGGLTISGAIGDGSGGYGVTKAGNGSLTLSNAGNTYSGVTTVSAGTLIVGANAPSGGAGALGSATSAVVLGDANTGSAYLALLTGGGYDVARDITVAAYGSGTTLGGNSAHASTFSGNITLNKAATLTAANGGTVDFQTGTWATGDNAITIAATGSGVVELSQNLATSAGITVSSGALRLNSTFTGNMTVQSGTVLAGSGTVTGTSGITGGTVNGSGLTLTGLATFTDNGNVLSGTVTATANGVTLATDAALNLTGALTGFLVVGNGTLTGSGSVSQTTSVTGGTVNGTGLTLTGVTTFNSTGNTLDGTVNSTAGIALASGAALALPGTLTGNAALGDGTLTGAGTISGNATLAGGIINLTNPGQIMGTLGATGGAWNGAGTVGGLITSSSGTFTIGSGANLTATTGLTVSGGTLAAGNAASTIAGSVNYTSGSDSTFAGVITGAGKTLTLNNAAVTLTLSGASDYTGATTVSAGTLAVSGTLGNTAVAVASGATLRGGTIGGSVSVTGGTVRPGTAAAVGTLSTGGLALDSASTTVFRRGGLTSGDKIAITGNLTLDGTIDLVEEETIAAGEHVIMTYTGSLTDSGAVIGSYPANTACSIVNPATTPGEIRVLVTFLPEINVTGNGVGIASGDDTPSAADDTDFGTTGGSVVRTFTIQNLGRADLTVTSIGFDPSTTHFTVGALTPPSPIPASGSATVDVTFAPNQRGTQSATVTIAHNDATGGESPYTFAVQGYSLVDASRTWDANATGTGQTDGGGTWTGANQWWTGLGNSAWNSGTPNSAIIGLGGEGGTLTLGTVTAGTITFNTFTGTYTLSGGGLTVNGGLTINTGAGAVTVSSPVTLGGSQTWANNAAGTLTVSGNVDSGANTLTLGGSGNATVTGILGSGATKTGGFTKSGSGTATLSGSSVHQYTGATAVNGGTLLLDFANLATPTDFLNNGSILNLGGGSLTLKGKTGGGVSTSQTLGNVTLNAGGSQVLIDPNGGDGTTLTLGTLTATASGGALLVGTAPSAGSGSVTITTSSNKDTQDIYGGRIVFSDGTAYDWATTASGSAPYTLSGYAGYVTMVAGATSDTNNDVTGSLTLTGAHTHNSLKITSGATVALGANLLTLSSGGLLATGSAASTISGSGTPGVTAGNGSGVHELVIHQYNTVGLTVSAVIGDNGGNPVSVIAQGAGPLVLSGANTFSGGLTIQGGLVLEPPQDSTPTTPPVTSGPLGTGTFTFNGGTYKVDGNAANDVGNDFVIAGTPNTVDKRSNHTNGGTLNVNGNLLVNVDNTFYIQNTHAGSSGNVAVSFNRGVALANNIEWAVKGAASGMTLTLNTGANGITLSGGAGSAPTIRNAGSSSVTVKGALIGAATGQSLILSSDTATLGGTVDTLLAGANSPGLTIDGGRWNFVGSSTYAGGTTLQNGGAIAPLTGNSSPSSGAGPIVSGPVGTGTVTVYTGGIFAANNTSNTLLNPFVLGGGTFTVDKWTGTQGGSLTLNGSLTVNAPSTINAVTTQGGSLSVTVAGPVTLNAPLTVTGTAAVSFTGTTAGGHAVTVGDGVTLSGMGVGGLLSVNSQNALGTGAVTVNYGGSLTLSTGFNPSNNMVLNAGSAIRWDNSGTLGNTPGTLTVNSMAFLDSGTGGGGNQVVKVSGNTFPTKGVLFIDTSRQLTMNDAPYPTLTGTMVFSILGGTQGLSLGALNTGTAGTLGLNDGGSTVLTFASTTLAGNLTIAGSGNTGLTGMVPAGAAGALAAVTKTGDYDLTVAMAPAGAVSATPSATSWRNLTLNSGTLILGNADFLGAGTTTLNGGALRLSGNLSKAIAVGAGGGVLESDASARTYSGVLTAGGAGNPDVVLRTVGANLTVSGASPAFDQGFTLASAGVPATVIFLTTDDSTGAAGNTIVVPAGLAFGFGDTTRATNTIGKFSTSTDSVLNWGTLGGAVNLSSSGLNKNVWLGLSSATSITGYTLPDGETTYKIVPIAASTIGNSVFSGGNALTVSAGAVPTDSASSATAVLGAGITLTLSAAQSYSGTTTVQGVVRNARMVGGVGAPGLTIGASGDLSGTTGITLDKSATMNVSGGVANYGRITKANVPITVMGGAIFTDGDTTAGNNDNVANRIAYNPPGNNGAVLTLGGTNGGGTFRLALPGTAGTTHNQTLASLSLGAGANVISSVNTGAADKTGTLTIDSGTITRAAGAVLQVTPALGFGTTAGQGGVKFTTSPTLYGPSGKEILRGSYVFLTSGANVNADWATLDGSKNVIALPDASYSRNTYAADSNLCLDLPLAGANVSLTAGSDDSINSVAFRMNTGTGRTATLNLSGNNIITTGGILVAGPLANNNAFITGGTSLTSGTGELVVNYYNQNSLTISSKIGNGSNQVLTKSGTGSGALVLSNASNEIGDVYAMGGTITATAGGALGSLTGTRTAYLYGGTVLFNHPYGVYTATGLVVGPQGGTIGTDTTVNSGAKISGAVTLNGNLGIGGGSQMDGKIELAGTITGPGMVNMDQCYGKAGDYNLLTLSGNNANWSGGVRIGNNTAQGPGTVNIRFASGASAGTGPIVVTTDKGGNVILDSAATSSSTYSNDFQISAGSLNIGIWSLGPGLGNGSGSIATLTGRLVGSPYNPIFQGWATGDTAVSEMVLAGTVSFAGAPTVPNRNGTAISYGTATVAQNFVNGQGGITLGLTGYVGMKALTLQEGNILLGDGTTPSNDGALGFIRFSGTQSFIPGAVGPGYLAALRRAASTYDGSGQFGYLLTGTATPTIYAMPEGKSFVIGSLGTGAQRYGTLGVAGGGTATLLGGPKAQAGQLLYGVPGGDVNIHANAASDSQTLKVFARAAGDTLVLGSGTASENVVFAPTWGDSGATSAITLMRKRTNATALNKVGLGTVEVKGVAFTHTDGTDARGSFTWNVNEGTLRYDQTDTGASYAAFNVNNGGTLGGTGTVAAAVVVASAGTVNPGTSGTAGTLGVNNITFQADSTYTADVGAGAGNADKLAIAGAASIAGGAKLVVNQLAAPNQGKYVLATAASGLDSAAFTCSTVPAGYVLVASATELALVHKADQMLILIGANPTNVHANVSLDIAATLTNMAPAGSADLNVALTDNGGSLAVTDLASIGGPTVAAQSASTVTGLVADVGSAGGGKTWSIKNTDAGAVTAETSCGGTVNVYAWAAANAITTPIALGTIHKDGAFAASALSIQNTAPDTGGYTERLNASVGSSTGDATHNSGSISLLAAEATDNTSITVSLGGTATAGAKSGTVTVTLASDGTGTSGLGTTALTPQVITINGYVYSGDGVWNVNSDGNWSVAENWTALGGVPGLDPAFTTTDTATFGSAATSVSPQVSLNNTSPYVRALIFDNASYSYSLVQGTGVGKLNLTGGGGSTITVAAGSHTIGVPAVLRSNLSIGGVGSLTVTAPIEEALGPRTLTKNGEGILSLTGTHSYSGLTTVSGGTLNGTGTLAGSLKVTGGVLEVTGTTGTRTVAGLEMTGGALKLTGAAATCGKVIVTAGGSVALGNGVATLDVTYLSTPRGFEITLIDVPAGGIVTGTFSGMPEGAAMSLDGRSYKITYHGGTGNDVTLLPNPASVFKFR